MLFLALTSDAAAVDGGRICRDHAGAAHLDVPGVAQVQIFGAQKYAVRVQVDPRRAGRHAASASTKSQQALADANSTRRSARSTGNRQLLTVQATGQLTKAADYPPLIVAYRNGAPVRLREVATRHRQRRERSASRAGSTTTRAIVLAIQRQPDANTVEVVDSIKALLPTLQAQLPAAIEMRRAQRSLAVDPASVDDVQFTLMLTHRRWSCW